MRGESWSLGLLVLQFAPHVLLLEELPPPEKVGVSDFSCFKLCLMTLCYRSSLIPSSWKSWRLGFFVLQSVPHWHPRLQLLTLCLKLRLILHPRLQLCTSSFMTRHKLKHRKSETPTFPPVTQIMCHTHLDTLFLEKSLFVLPLPFLAMHDDSVRLFLFVTAVPISSLSTWGKPWSKTHRLKEKSARNDIIGNLNIMSFSIKICTHADEFTDRQILRAKILS